MVVGSLLPQKVGSSVVVGNQLSQGLAYRRAQGAHGRFETSSHSIILTMHTTRLHSKRRRTR